MPRNLNCVSVPVPTSFATCSSQILAAAMAAFTSNNCSAVAASANRNPRARSSILIMIQTGLVRTCCERTPSAESAERPFPHDAQSVIEVALFAPCRDLAVYRHVAVGVDLRKHLVIDRLGD